MRFTITVLTLLLSALLSAQAPALIPYQAVARDGAGQPLSNAAISARFTIHNETANGTVVWQEVQTVNTNSLGLFTSQLGGTSSLAAVNWAIGSKFLQVELDAGSGFFEIGTQQMLSVPYALHAGSVQLDVSPAGDTLFIGDGSFVIVPGLSAANGYTTGTTLHTCGTPNVHNPDRIYGTMTDQEGHVYKTIAIGSQVWMAENLNTSIYRNGDAITTSFSNTDWNNAANGAWAFHSDNTSNVCPYGKLYNWFACVDSRQLCPTGWHVPSADEWNVLSDFLGGSALAGSKMKSVGTNSDGTGLWFSSNTADNSSGFSGVPGGARGALGIFNGLTQFGSWWSASESNAQNASRRTLDYFLSSVLIDTKDKNLGFSVRCVRD
jgi:uncharacterized protein (TIGR02145 family)